MKVVEYSDAVLRLEDRAVLLRVLGAIFALAGVSVLVVPEAWGGISKIVGLFFIVLGAAVAFVPRNTFIRFDRGTGAVALERIGLLLPKYRREVPLDLIEKVEVEEVGSGSDATYRVRLLIKGEDPLPFTEYSGSGEAAQYQLFQRVYGWLKGMPG